MNEVRLAERLARTERERDLIAREFSDFVGAISHDIRGPLQVQKGLLSLIQSHTPPIVDQQTDRFLKLIDRSADRLDAMVCGLVEWSRVGMTRVAPAPIDTAAFVVACEFDLRDRLSTIDGRVTWGPLPPSICGDANQLRRALTLLIDNGLVHHGPGQPNIQVQVQDAAAGWRVAVVDDGPGIAAADVERIFRPFQRLGNSVDNVAAGMGLTICQRIIEHHGGTLAVETSPGEGATFFFTLPHEPPQALHI